MDRDAIGKALEEAIRKRRGYADFFDWPEKSLKEWGVAQRFVEELERDHGALIESSNQHPGGKNRAPDFQLVTKSDEVWGVAITEFVSSEAIIASKCGITVSAEWPDNELISKCQAIVARKDQPENVRGGPYDRYVLLVHVDECMLPADRISSVAGTLKFKTRLIDEIYVLLSYDPRAERYPLLNFKPEKV